MKGNLLGFDLSVLDFYLISRENNGDILTDARKVAMPVWDIFVGNTRRNVKHDNGTLTLNIIPVTQSPKFFLPSSIPDVELNGTPIGVEYEGVNLNAKGGNVLLLEFTRQMSLDKGGFSNPSIADKDELKFRNLLLSRLQWVN